MTLSELQQIAEIALPAMTVVALAGTGAVGYLLGGQHILRLRRVVARQDQSIQALEGELSEAEAIVRRVTGGTEEILAAVRGAHRRAACATCGGTGVERHAADYEDGVLLSPEATQTCMACWGSGAAGLTPEADG